MWKKTFIRSTLIGMVILACLLVFATTQSPKSTVTDECTKSQKEGCEKKTQGDFIIWESLGRTLLTNIQY
jgi:hypothetical protein